MDQQSSKQMQVLREIDLILSSKHMRFWLRGGWGIDFMLGRLTRSHADLDLVTWQRHRKGIQRALVGAGFRPEGELMVQTDLAKDGQDITFVFLVRDPEGSIVAHGVPEWIWRPEALPRRRYCLEDVCARVVAPDHMLHDLETYEAATGRPPRPKDALSRKLLREIIRGPEGEPGEAPR